MKKDLNQIFDELLTRYIKTIDKNYQSRYKKAKDKEFVKEEFVTDAGFVLGWEYLSTENAKLIDLFSVMYKRGDDIITILAHIKKTYGEVDDVRPFKRIENGKSCSSRLAATCV